MESDGLGTVKNKGRHDIYGKWADIEKHWVDVVLKQSGDKSCQWLKPNEHLSYQLPQKPFEIYEEDFKKAALDYLMFKKGIESKEFEERLLYAAMYSSSIKSTDDKVVIALTKGGDNA